jgi:predicted RNase H-like HicB family nuclease
MNFTLECEQEDDGRWLAEVLDLPGALAYGGTKDGAMAKAEALALRVVAERLEHGEASPMAITISLTAAASAKSMSAIPQLVRGIPALALGPGIPARMIRQAAKLSGRHSGRMPESVRP